MAKMVDAGSTDLNVSNAALVWSKAKPKKVD